MFVLQLKNPGILYRYCTCTAVLLGCYNHVIHLLFHAEAMVRTSATKPSSTSLLSEWNVPTGVKSKLVQKPISEVASNKFHHRKDSSSEDKIEAANGKYKSFEFSSPEKSKLLKNKNQM